MGRWGAGRLASVVVVLLVHSFGVAAIAEPRTVNNTPGLYERVLTKPGAQVHQSPGGAVHSTPGIFNAFYVFDEETAAGETWLHVGPNISTTPTGWVAENTVLPFDHGVIMQFTPRAQRSRALFFDSSDRMATFLNRPDAQSLLNAANAAPDGAVNIGGVIAREPEEFVDPTERFYLMPVLGSEEISHPDLRRPLRVYETASVPIVEAADPQLTELRVGVIFVIDTTQSMRPYIEAAREAVRDLYEEMKAEDLGDAVRFGFGLVGYRDNETAAPGIGYLTREYYPLSLEFDEADFLAALDNMDEATVSTRDWQEDGVAGLKVALETPAWKHFFVRHIVMITDAGLRDGSAGDGLASERTSPNSIADLARDTARPYSIATLFLETDSDPVRLNAAREQMRGVSRWSDNQSAFFAVTDGSANTIKRGAQRILTDALAYARTDVDLARLRQQQEDACPPDEELSPDDELSCILIERSLAMRLAWLGATSGRQAPAVIRGWVSDRPLDDVSDPPALSPHVLMTRNQLDDLFRALKGIELAYQAASDDDTPEQLFEVIQSIFAQAQRDPSLIPGLGLSDDGTIPSLDEFETLGDALPGFLEGLPFKTAFERMDVTTWLSLSARQQSEFIGDIENMIFLLETTFDNPDKWVQLNDDAAPGEEVYAVPKDWFPEG